MLTNVAKVLHKGEPLIEKNLQAFKGSENPIAMSRFYKTSFTCNFDLSWYPFETQKCSMIFVLEEVYEKKVELVLGTLNYSGPLELTQYFIKNIRMGTKVVENQKMVIVDVYLGRRLLSIIITVFIPSLIIYFV